MSYKLKLNLDGVSLIIGIDNYIFSTSWSDDLWVDSYISIINKYINYEDKGEMFECFEITDLKKTFKNLLERKEIDKITFIEDDIEFEFYSYTEESKTILAEFIVYFRDGGASTANSIHLFMEEEDIEKFYYYLRLATHEINENNVIIKEYIDKGVILNY